MAPKGKLSFFKNLFVVEDVPGEQPTEKKEEEAIPAPALAAVTPTLTNDRELEGVVTDMEKLLKERYTEWNTEGFDFYEYEQSIEKADSESVLATISTLGVTPAKLVTSGKSYLKKLDQEKVDFDEELVEATKEVAEKQKELEEVAVQLVKLESKKINLENSVSKTRDKVQRSKAGFEIAFNKVKERITTHITELEKIKGGN